MLERLLRPLTSRSRIAAATLRVQNRVGEMHGGSLASSVTLAAFVSLFPILLVGVAILGVIAGRKPDLAGEIVRQLNLSGDSSRLVHNIVETATKSKKAASIIGLVGLLWSGLGLVGAMNYAIDSVWQVQGRGIKDKAFGLLWLAGAGALFAATFGVTAALRYLPGWCTPLGLLVGLGVNAALFLWTFRILGNSDVPWRALIPGSIFGAAGLEVLKIIGGIYVPRAIASSSALYGSLGVVFAILAWLLFFGRLVVYASTLNVVRWEDQHGTVTVDLEVPKIPGEVPVEATRSGEVSS